MIGIEGKYELVHKITAPNIAPKYTSNETFPSKGSEPNCASFFSRRRRSCDPQGRGKVTLLKSILSEKVVRGNNELRESLSQRINQKCANKIQVSYQEGSTWNKRQVLRSLSMSH